ncbi:surfeit locus protein 2 [Actinidia rufa]|uniref:Surfeit locus protein 2 n=1 Tax=Actinidia rufa TaxID=165716 RepID=A0A7J0DAV9_9ERIC|nr:surfeit locus protein 2 [Actinidia rufa]
MGKKGVKGGAATNDKEGKNLLGQQTFKELANGRFKCVETGHEVPYHAKDFSKLICKLTGDTVNKSEKHIWKHINGRRFLNMLEKKEAKKETSNGVVAETEKKPEKKQKLKADSLKKKKKKEEEDVDKVISEVRNSSDKDRDSEEAEFWMPQAGKRWDFDSGGDRGVLVQSQGVSCEDGKDDAKELSKRTKRMSMEIGPSSDYASRKKKKKTKPT